MAFKLELLDDNLNEIEIKEKKSPESCKAPKPVIMISKKCRYQMHALAKLVTKQVGDYEAFGYLIGTKIGEAEETVIPEHEVSSASVEVSPENIASVQSEIEEKNKARKQAIEDIKKKNEEIEKENESIRQENEKRIENGDDPLPEKSLVDVPEYKPLRIIGWFHSHGNMSAFSSGTDDTQHKTIHDELVSDPSHVNEGDEDTPSVFYIVGITVNAHKQEYGVIYASYPCGLEQQIEKVAVNDIESEPLTKDEKRQIVSDMIEQVKTKVKTRVSRWEGWGQRRKWWKKSTNYHSRSNITRSLDKYYESPVTDSDDVEENAIDQSRLEEITLSNVFKDEGLKEDFMNLRNFLDSIEIESDGIKASKDEKQEKSTAYDGVKKLLRKIMESERRIIIDMVKNIVDEKTEDNYYMYSTIDDDEEDEYDEEELRENSIDASGLPVRCASCGVDLEEENFDEDYDEEGYPLCSECQEKSENNYDDYWDDNSDPVKCVSCGIELLEGSNFYNDLDDEGFPLCNDCVEKNPGMDEENEETGKEGIDKRKNTDEETKINDGNDG